MAKVSFRRAEKKKAWLKIALTGPSGSGKTLSALFIASGMGTRIAVIDTENESAALYADRIPQGYDHLTIDPPYTIPKYIEAISAALEAKYEVLIIDSITHAWAGEGGLLQQKEEIDARGGKGEKNKYANWAGITKQHEQFKAWLLKADIHLICTMRSKQDYVLGEGNAPIKVGMAPIQREGMEYEFTTVLDIAMNHSAKASKDRTGLFDTRIFVPSRETGLELTQWLNAGAGELTRRSPEQAARSTSEKSAPGKQPAEGGGRNAPPSVVVPPGFQSADSHAQATRLLWKVIRESNWTETDVRGFLRERFPKAEESTRALAWDDFNVCLKHIENNPRPKTAEEKAADFLDKNLKTDFAPADAVDGVPIA